MDNFIFSINVTFPIFLVILLGYILRKIGLINDNFISIINKYVFTVALPVMLFKDIATSDVITNVNPTFVVYCMVVTIVMFMAVWGLSYLLIKDKSLVGAFAQGAARGSAAILGVAFVENICGNAGMTPLMIVAAVPFFNVLSVIILTFSADFGKESAEESSEESLEESLQNDEAAKKKEAKLGAIKKSLINIAKNPIIIGIFVGIPFALLNVKIPTIPMKTINYIAQTATPMALLAIGGGFDGKKAITRVKPAVAASIVKLLILPAIFLPLAIYLKFETSELIAALIMLASPTTVSCYIMAKNMGNDEVLTSNIIMITTLMSSVTLTFWIFILRSMGLI